MNTATLLPLTGMLLLLVFSGCSSLTSARGPRYETIRVDPHHDTATARKETEKALKWIDKSETGKAHEALERALIADVTYAPAHNNLGWLYYCQRNYYLAAWEFECALKLVPESPEVHNNLGLVYEAARRPLEAISSYEAAVALAPDNAEYIGNLVRAKIMGGERSPDTARLLHELVFRDTRPQWVEWAQEQLSTSHVKFEDSLQVSGTLTPAASEARPPSDSKADGPRIKAESGWDEMADEGEPLNRPPPAVPQIPPDVPPPPPDLPSPPEEPDAPPLLPDEVPKPE